MTYSTQSKDCPAMKANTAGWGVLKWTPENRCGAFVCLFSFLGVLFLFIYLFSTGCVFLPFVLNFKIQRGNEWNVCFAVCVPQHMSFHQKAQIFSGRVIPRHPQKQLTLSGFVNAFCPYLFVMWTIQILFSEFLVKLRLLIPEPPNWQGKVSLW